MTHPSFATLDRQGALDTLLSEMGSVVVAFSGGVDSSYLAVRAHLVLGRKALAVTAVSASLSAEQRAVALDVVTRFGLAHRLVHTQEMLADSYRRNGPDRCYFCKAELFSQLRPLARSEGLAWVADGLVTDDMGDFRPGRQAAAEAGVRSPLTEAGLAKSEVRLLARTMKLPNWDRPASPCLSSRVPYGTTISPALLRRVERAEEALRALGFRELRVRHLGNAGRVELAPAELPRLEDPHLRARVEEAVRGAGYEQVHIDEAGYRRGRLNEALDLPPASGRMPPLATVQTKGFAQK